MQEKSFYINEAAKEGVLVAFERIDELDNHKHKVLSGMIVNVFDTTFEVKTKNGKMFVVPKHSVLWVKTGKRWPKGIYQQLRGEHIVKG